VGTGVGGGVGTGGDGTGTGPGLGEGVGAGVSGQSPIAEHVFVQSVVQRPPLPPEGYSPQELASPHLLQQHDAPSPIASAMARIAHLMMLKEVQILV